MPREVAGMGRWGEDRAVEFLQRQNFSVIERNYNSSVGEIDIIAKKGDDFYFVEVKTRSAGPFATNLAVTGQKLHKLKKTVARYCLARRINKSGLILASLLVVYDRSLKKVNFNFSIIY